MIALESDRLVFRFPEVHEDARCSLGFQRTLRIPDDGKDYPLPPGLGRFPLRHLDDYARRLPDGWLRRGGAIFPMHRAEATWIDFNCGYRDYPCAVKVATGKICAVTGDPWTNRLNTDPQDYLALPDQPWLDGYCVEKGVIRQFVAMPLGEGYTAEEQLTGAARHGGLQIFVCPMKRERYEALKARRDEASADLEPGEGLLDSLSGMGLAPGGRMKQEIYDDPHGLDAWDQRRARRCFVTVANSAQWLEIAGERPPTQPPGAKDYTEAGLPWFDYYGGDRKARSGAPELAGLASIAAVAKRKDEAGVPENESVDASRIVRLRAADANRVREYRVDG